MQVILRSVRRKRKRTRKGLSEEVCGKEFERRSSNGKKGISEGDTEVSAKIESGMRIETIGVCPWGRCRCRDSFSSDCIVGALLLSKSL